MLRNEKYVGRWIWNRTEHRRDPRTLKSRQFPKDQTKWCVIEDESLRIVTQELWQKVQERLKEIERVWGRGNKKRGYENQQASRVLVYPRQLLSGAMFCAKCGGSIGEVSGRKGGYYGCVKARRSICDNRLLVRRKKAERVILTSLRDRILNPDSIEYVLQKVKGELDRLNSSVPQAIKSKEAALNEQRRRVSNLVEVVAEGRGTRSVTDALSASESQVEGLEAEIEVLQRSLTESFQIPPRVWIEERLRDFQKTLELNTGLSALILRKVLGRIRLEVIVPEVGHPYYVAHTNLDIVELLDPRTGNFRADRNDPRSPADRPAGGSNALRSWRRGELNPRPKTAERWPLHACSAI